MAHKRTTITPPTSPALLEAARAVYINARQDYAASGTSLNHALREYVAKCVPYIEKIPEFYVLLKPAEIAQVMGSLEGIVSIIENHEAVVVAVRRASVESRAPEQDTASEMREQLTYEKMSPGRKAAYTRMSPGKKAAYTKRMKKHAVASKAASAEIVTFDREKAQALREQLGYSRDVLGKNLKLSPSYLAAIESGQSQVSENPRGTKMKRYLQWYQKNIGA